MIVYLIKQKGITKLNLPKKVNGSYLLSDYDLYNDERQLLNIVAEDNNWVVYNNENVKIFDDTQEYTKVKLTNYRQLYVKVGEETLILYTCPVVESNYGILEIVKNVPITIGKKDTNVLVYNNKLVSDEHATISLVNNVWVIEDKKSMYGTYVNGERINGKAYLFNGDVVFIMGLKIILMNNMLFINNPNNLVGIKGDLFKIAPPRPENNIDDHFDENVDVKLYTDDDYFSRVPRFSEKIEPAHFILDDYPTVQKPEEQPAILTIGPMLTMSMSSLSMVFVSVMNYQNNKNIWSIVPTIVMGITMIAGTFLWPTLTRRYQRKKYEKDKEEIKTKYTEYLNKKTAELNQIIMSQKQILLSNNISTREAYNMIIGKSKNLWKRELHQSDFLNIRLGLGKVPVEIDYQFPEEHFRMEEDELFTKVQSMLDSHKYVEDAPIVESLIDSDVLAITGKDEHIYYFFKNLLIQIIFLHSYYDLKIVLFTNKERSKQWEFIKQLPHIFSNDKELRFFADNDEDAKEIGQYLLNVYNTRESSSKFENKDEYKKFDEYYLIITDDYDSIKGLTVIDKALKCEGNPGMSIVILNKDFANLPIECNKFIGINSFTEGGIIDTNLSESGQKIFSIEKSDDLNLKACSIILNNVPMLNKKEMFKMPKIFGFLEMFKVGNVDQLNSVERWKFNDPIVSLATPVGINSNGGLFKLDLHEKEHGPHGLIAGMTGSGKSDFIISFILSLAVNYHPYEVQFVLIDYKGGGLVGAFENKESGVKLPHLAGTITNLDKAEIDRALASIHTELERRQALFNRAKEALNESTIDIYKYQKYYRDGLIETPLSHLFIISDEFAELKQQQPDFMQELISTARIGRSLGVHLILATQKPSGVVNDQIWSNSRFKICLKVSDATDSNEVIKRPDAAYLKDPGRFYLQVGFNELFDIGQAAYSEMSYIPQDKMQIQIDDNINFIDNIGKNIKTINSQKYDSSKVQGEQLTNVVKYLYDLAQKEQIVTKELWLEKLASVMYYDDVVSKYNFTKKEAHIETVIGIYDDPKRQIQNMLTIDLTEKGNLVIYSMNERNTIVDTILYSFINTYNTEELNAYILDFDSQTLKTFIDAPQIGDVIFNTETEKVEHLFRTLSRELEERKVLMQNYNANFEFYNKNSEKKVPAIVLMVHGFENFKESFEVYDQAIEKIAREGARYGIYVIITAVTERSLRMNLRNSLPQILPLKLQAQIDYNMLLGKKTPTISDSDNRGIALVDDGVYEFQTAIISEPEERYKKISDKITSLKEVITEQAEKIKILPETVTWEDVSVKPLKITEMPIGLEVKTLKVSYFNLVKNMITTIHSNNEEMLTNFTKLIYHKLKTLEDISLMVFDMNKMFLFDDKLEIPSFEDMDKVINDSSRQKPLLVYITGVAKWLELFPDEIKNNLTDYLEKASGLKNVFFVFIDKLQDDKPLTYEPWYKKFVPTDYGIFVGKGIANSNYYVLTTPYRELSEVIPDNFGYNMTAGIATKIKLFEGEKDEQ